MTRQELASEIAKRTGQDATVTRKTMEAFISLVMETVAAGEGVYLRGFGTFSKATRAAKKARNIKTGETVMIPERSAVRFKPAREFTEALK